MDQIKNIRNAKPQGYPNGYLFDVGNETIYIDERNRENHLKVPKLGNNKKSKLWIWEHYQFVISLFT